MSNFTSVINSLVYGINLLLKYWKSLDSWKIVGINKTISSNSRSDLNDIITNKYEELYLTEIPLAKQMTFFAGISQDDLKPGQYSLIVNESTQKFLILKAILESFSDYEVNLIIRRLSSIQGDNQAFLVLNILFFLVMLAYLCHQIIRYLKQRKNA